MVYLLIPRLERLPPDNLVDFNLDFYTEVQDLSYLENALSTSTPRFAALNMAMISLIEDYNIVGFETLAVEVRLDTRSSSYNLCLRGMQDKNSMLNITRAIDRATGYVFVPPQTPTPRPAPSTPLTPAPQRGPTPTVVLRRDQPHPRAC